MVSHVKVHGRVGSREAAFDRFGDRVKLIMSISGGEGVETEDDGQGAELLI